MDYAIVDLGGHQIWVEEGQYFATNKLEYLIEQSHVAAPPPPLAASLEVCWAIAKAFCTLSGRAALRALTAAFLATVPAALVAALVAVSAALVAALVAVSAALVILSVTP